MDISLDTRTILMSVTQYELIRETEPPTLDIKKQFLRYHLRTDYGLRMNEGTKE